MIKSKFKRVTSLFLATLMCVTTFAGISSTTAYAASGEKADVYMVDFPRDGDANYDGVWGHSNLTLKNGWHTGRSNFTNLKAIGSYSGNVAYCIEPGISLKVGQTMNKYDENYFNNLASNGVISGDEIRLFVGRILQYGYRGTISTSWRSQNEAAANSIAQAYATQLLIWETVIPQKDLKKFTEQAKRYGVLYCVLRDKNTKGENTPVDIIARAEDASKIQRIVERFELGKVDKASIVSEAEKAIADREAVEKEKPTKSKSEIIMEEAVRNPMQKEERANANPSVAKTDKSPLSRQNSEPVETQSDKGVAKPVEKPSVKEKLDRYKAQAKQQKEAERKEPEVKKDGKKPQQKNGQTVHRQPKKKPKTKER